MQYLNSKTYLSSQEFIEIWTLKYIDNPAYSRFYEKTRITTINKDSIVVPGEETILVRFTNVVVVGSINLYDETIYQPIIICDATFNDNFLIQNGSFLNFYIRSISGSNIFAHGINIIGGVFKNDSSIKSIESGAIEIHGGTFETQLSISDCENSSVRISRAKFADGLTLYGRFKSVLINGGTFNSDLQVYRVICDGNFQIIGGFASKYLSNDNAWSIEEHRRELKFDNSGIAIRDSIVVKGNMVISDVEAKFINLTMSRESHTVISHINNLYVINFSRNFELGGGDENAIFVNNLQFESSTIQYGSAFRLTNLYIGDLTFKNVISQGTIFISQIINGKVDLIEKPREPNVKPFYSKDNLMSLHTKCTLEIKGTDFGSSTIFNSDFSECNFIFENSRLDNLYLAGALLPLKLNSGNNLKDYREKIAYSQLKKVFEKNDWHTSNLYALQEIEAYRSLLRTKEKTLNDKIVLSLNRITSKHGTSWIKAMKCILLFNIVAYASLLGSLNFTFELSIQGVETYLKLLAYSFTFLNPIHRPDFLSTSGFPNIKWGPRTEVIDGISRLVNAYLIYQFIQAFRKFGKS